ncbi:hypothetical protein AB0L00_44605 [Actinoallomurus sp. NPDC052308]|uniref:hypothetical protein n=1 Tax=Actinoallomurus sp. NPDC052308 TaxID=3155530 RepID=UPI0034191A53
MCITDDPSHGTASPRPRDPHARSRPRSDVHHPWFNHRLTIEAIRSHRRIVGGFLGIAALCLPPWIIYLHMTLPHHYTATHWPRTWMVFDSALVLSLSRTAYLSICGRSTRTRWSTISATLLLCDAWFDVSTATAADLLVSVLMALLLELPLAALLYAISAAQG